MASVTMPARNVKVVSYVARLNAAVGRLPHAEACDFVREIEAHISDKLEGRVDDAEVEGVLASLGSPEDLAQRYATELMFTRASRTFSPWLLLRTAARWAKAGAKGTAVFLFALCGYAAGFGLTLTVLLKPFIPSIGLWVGPHTFDFGTASNAPGVHEVLGPYYTPITTLLAFAIVVGTTQALRRMFLKRTAGSTPYASIT